MNLVFYPNPEPPIPNPAAKPLNLSPMSETPAESDPTPATPAPPAGRPPRPKKDDEPQGLWKGWIRPFLVVILIVTALRSSLLDWNDVPTGSMRHTIAVGDRIVVNKLSYGFNPPFNGPKISIPLVGIELPNPADFLPGFYWSAPQRNDIVTFWKPSTEELNHDDLVKLASRNPAIFSQNYPNVDPADPAQVRNLARRLDDGGTRMIKRVVAVGGDVVTMQPAVTDHRGKPYRYSALSINGEAATYRWDGDALIESLLGDEREVRYIRNPDARLLERNEQNFRVPQPWAVAYGPYTVPEGHLLMIGDNRDNSADGRLFNAVALSQVTGKAKFVAASFDGGILNPVWSRFFKSLNY